MPGLPRVSGRRVLTALLRAGFAETHIRGSHHYLRRPGGGLVVILVHGNHDLPLGTLRQAELSDDELHDLLSS